MNLNLHWLTIGALLALLLAVAAFWTLAYGLKGFIGLTIGVGLALAGVAVLKNHLGNRRKSQEA